MGEEGRSWGMGRGWSELGGGGPRDWEVEGLAVGGRVTGGGKGRGEDEGEGRERKKINK